MVLVKEDQQILVVMLGDFLVDRSARRRIGNAAVFSSHLEDNDAGELGDLATKKWAVLDSKGNGLTVQGLGPAEFLNEKPLKIKLSQTVAHVVHVDRHTSNNPLAVSKTKRANDAWFLGLLFLMNDTQPVCLSQLDHQLSQGFIADTTTELAVQGVNSRLA